MASSDTQRSENTEPLPRVAVIGCGLIGQAWAVVFLRAGYGVTLFDPNETALQEASPAIEAKLNDLVAAGLMSAQNASTARGQLIVATDLTNALEGAVYVQENAPENLELKSALTRQIDRLLPEHVPIGSSTSGIPASDYARDVAGRHRCLVAHPINPPHLVPAVEIVPAPWTDPDITQTVCDLMQRVGQSPVLLEKEIDGFVVNRLQGALLREAFRLLSEGVASHETIDTAISDGLGLRWALMGPFETIHLNAPGGVAQYVERYGPLYRKMFAEQARTDDWEAALDMGLQEALCTQHPLDQLAQSHTMRDKRLMQLLRSRNPSGELSD